MDIHWKDSFDFRGTIPALLSEEVPIVRDILTEITKNQLLPAEAGSLNHACKADSKR